MEERRQPRQRRRPDGPRYVRRSVSLLEPLALSADEQARKEGHDNFSAILSQALIDYLNRQNDPRVA